MGSFLSESATHKVIEWVMSYKLFQALKENALPIIPLVSLAAAATGAFVSAEYCDKNEQDEHEILVRCAVGASCVSSAAGCITGFYTLAKARVISQEAAIALESAMRRGVSSRAALGPLRHALRTPKKIYRGCGWAGLVLNLGLIAYKCHKMYKDLRQDKDKKIEDMEEDLLCLVCPVIGVVLSIGMLVAESPFMVVKAC